MRAMLLFAMILPEQQNYETKAHPVCVAIRMTNRGGDLAASTMSPGSRAPIRCPTEKTQPLSNLQPVLRLRRIMIRPLIIMAPPIV